MYIIQNFSHERLLFNPVDTVGSYIFKITDVLPYPVSTKTVKLEDYDVVLTIEKLSN